MFTRFLNPISHRMASSLRFILAALCLALLSLIASAAPPAESALHANPALARGSYQVTLHLAILSSLPSSTAIICRAVADPAPLLLSSESVTALAVVSGNEATCALQFPIAWSPSEAAPEPQLHLSVAAMPASGPLVAPLRHVALPAIAVRYPQPNGVRAIDLPLTF